jgi:DNA-binding NtrC family response regulator
MPNVAVLLVSSDPSLIEACQEMTASIGNLDCVVLSRSEEADAYLRQEQLALVLLHVAGKDGTEQASRFLRRIGSLRRPVATIILGERHEPQVALTLLRQGAADFLSRPLDLNRLAYLTDSLTLRARYASSSLGPRVGENLTRFLTAGDEAETACSSPARAGSTSEAGPTVPGPGVAAGNDCLSDVHAGPMGSLMEQVTRVAPQDMIILLSGETGTGKTRLARLIHDLSPRRVEPFLVINCGALAPTLIESEMFGHIKGAFTGADRDRIGKFAGAGRGTLLLDDIDCLPLSLQAKLLRAIEERVFEPVGSNQSQPVRARVIAASNRLLEREMAAGRFRADLYYRLNVVTFHLPPLRERPGTIRQLAHTFLAEFAARDGDPARDIAPDALSALECYHWPGNIRELRNVLERAVTLYSEPELQFSHLPDNICAVARSRSDASWAEKQDKLVSASRLKRARGQAELARIVEALRKHGNNRLRAAAELGISRMTLYNKLRKYGLIDFA